MFTTQFVIAACNPGTNCVATPASVTIQAVSDTVVEGSEFVEISMSFSMPPGLTGINVPAPISVEIMDVTGKKD